MKIRVVLVACMGLLPQLGCGETPAPVAPTHSEVREAPDIPTYCASGDKPCVPAADFVEQLCGGRFASVAPYLFQKSTPFVRQYVNCRNCELKNALKGPISDRPLATSEELLLLRVTKGAAEQSKKLPAEIYDLLRWDGTCVTLPKRDVVAHAHGVAQAAPVEFGELDTTMRAAVLRDKKLSGLHASREAACKQNGEAADCSKANQALSDNLVAAIRQGLRLPMPRERPGGSGSRAQAATSINP